MCTICGSVADEEVSTDKILEMMKKMEHRGPDQHGVWADGVLDKSSRLSTLTPDNSEAKNILGHSRLAIVGKASSGQPYASCDDKLHLVHNGEIYNYKELESLLTENHERVGKSDSELVVHLLEESYNGDLTQAVRSVAPVLDGMVTMAVSDGESVVVSRDSIGKKPVYYSPNGIGTTFASEKKALSNPKRLKPGHMLVLKGAERDIIEFDRLRLPAIDIVEEEEGTQHYKHLFTKAVRKRLVGIEEDWVGVIFSGGIDSVLVAQQLINEGIKIRCYCAGTEESGDIQAARWAAEKMGFELKTRIFTPEEVEQRLGEIMYAVEETGQLQVEVAIPMYFAAEMAAEDGTKVVFTGQGADEILGGYHWYRGALADGVLALHRQMWHDFRMLYDETLEREDKLTMAHSLEQRAPYLDRAVVGGAMQISPLLKVRDSKDELRKWPHRKAAVELGVAEELAFRKKDPAQTGSGIHGIVEKIAENQNLDPDPVLVHRNRAADKGNLFRYAGFGPEKYGSPEARTYLEQLAIDQKLSPEPEHEHA